MISCIYTITNKVNKKIYLGKTNDFYHRRSQHRRVLNKNKHENEHLQRAWIKYGMESFEFEILEEVEEKYLFSMEHYWGNLLDVFNDKYGYNEKPTHPLNRGSNSIESREKARQANLGKRHSEESKLKMSLAKIGKVTSPETKLKMSLAQKGKVRSEETRKKLSINRLAHPLCPFLGKKMPRDVVERSAKNRKVPVIQYTLDMKFVKEWKSGLDADIELGINRRNIVTCCRLKRKSAGGFTWRYKDKYNGKIKN